MVCNVAAIHEWEHCSAHRIVRKSSDLSHREYVEGTYVFLSTGEQFMSEMSRRVDPRQMRLENVA